MKCEIKNNHQDKFLEYPADSPKIFITKNEFIKCYESNKIQGYKEFCYITEMFTTPHCFTQIPSFIDFEDTYTLLKNKSKYRGIILSISHDFKLSLIIK